MRSVVFQAELKFTFKAAALSLSSETEADDALPSGLSRFAQSEPTAPGESRHCSALPATLGICPRSHSQEKHGMDAAPITTEQNQPIRGFVHESSPGRAAQPRPRGLRMVSKGLLHSSIPWESPVITERL